mmetsp:Transcript_62280/g.148669  ORF Transcript_62280/g.148669 Transcript_62280/m.148669 type:complete len:217 (-) Transcript_62280:645-1295(-)
MPRQWPIPGVAARGCQQTFALRTNLEAEVGICNDEALISTIMTAGRGASPGRGGSAASRTLQNRPLRRPEWGGAAGAPSSCRRRNHHDLFGLGCCRLQDLRGWHRQRSFDRVLLPLLTDCRSFISAAIFCRRRVRCWCLSWLLSEVHTHNSLPLAPACPWVPSSCSCGDSALWRWNSCWCGALLLPSWCRMKVQCIELTAEAAVMTKWSNRSLLGE